MKHFLKNPATQVHGPSRCFACSVLVSVVLLFAVDANAQSLSHESAILNLSKHLTQRDRKALNEAGVTWSSSVNQQQVLVSIPVGSLPAVNEILLQANLPASLEPTLPDIKLSGLLNEDGEIPKRYEDAQGRVKLIAYAAPGNSLEAAAESLSVAGFATGVDPKVNGIIVTLPSTDVGRLAQQTYIERVVLAPGFPMLN